MHDHPDPIISPASQGFDIIEGGTALSRDFAISASASGHRYDSFPGSNRPPRARFELHNGTEQPEPGIDLREDFSGRERSDHHGRSLGDGDSSGAVGHGSVQVERNQLGEGLRVERTHDYETIRKIAIHPRIYPFIADDFSPMPSLWEPNEDENFYYLMAFKDKWPIGFAAFMPRTGICYEGHFCFLPAAWGKVALECAISMTKWMWEKTLAERLCGEIAGNNRLALSFVLSCGWEVYGVNARSWQKGGLIFDRICVGISRPQ